MKISTKGRYGLRAMVDLATHSDQKPISLGNIASRQGVSINYLEQAFALLKKAKLVKGTKGPSGGYQLGKAPEVMKVIEILEVLEGNLCIEEPEVDDGDDLMRCCIKKLVWQPIDEEFQEALTDMTLQDLLEDYYQQKECEGFMFYI